MGLIVFLIVSLCLFFLYIKLTAHLRYTDYIILTVNFNFVSRNLKIIIFFLFYFSGPLLIFLFFLHVTCSMKCLCFPFICTPTLILIFSNPFNCVDVIFNVAHLFLFLSLFLFQVEGVHHGVVWLTCFIFPCFHNRLMVLPDFHHKFSTAFTIVSNRLVSTIPLNLLLSYILHKVTYTYTLV